MPRASRYNRRVLSRSDVPQPEPPTPEQLAYEKSTKNFVTKKAGFGPFNDINLGALYRFGKENVAQNLTNLVKWNGGKQGIVRANDKMGQSSSILESFGPNAVENIVRNRRVSWDDAKTLGYLAKRVAPPLMAMDAVEMSGGAYLQYMLKRLAKLNRGPTSVYNSFKEQLQD